MVLHKVPCTDPLNWMAPDNNRVSDSSYKQEEKTWHTGLKFLEAYNSF